MRTLTQTMVFHHAEEYFPLRKMANSVSQWSACSTSLLDAACDWISRTIYTNHFLCPHLPLVITEWSRNFTQSMRGVPALRDPSMNDRISMLLMALFICSNSSMSSFKKHLDFTLSSLMLLCLKNSKYWKKLFSEHTSFPFLPPTPLVNEAPNYYYPHLLLQMTKGDLKREHLINQGKLLLPTLTSRSHHSRRPGVQIKPHSIGLRLN